MYATHLRMFVGGLALAMSMSWAKGQDSGPIDQAPSLHGHYGVGHEKWHREFYSKLKRNDGSPCCSNYDCRPTKSRWVRDHYEVEVEGRWTVVPWDIIKPEIAPDSGAHVCASPETDGFMASLFCVILPPDS
jgi:hypothetical protein